MAACALFEDVQPVGYYNYKALLRQEINNDWVLIDHDIWVSLKIEFICIERNGSGAILNCQSIVGQMMEFLYRKILPGN